MEMNESLLPVSIQRATIVKDINYVKTKYSAGFPASIQRATIVKDMSTKYSVKFLCNSHAPHK